MSLHQLNHIEKQTYHHISSKISSPSGLISVNWTLIFLVWFRTCSVLGDIFCLLLHPSTSPCIHLLPNYHNFVFYKVSCLSFPFSFTLTAHSRTSLPHTRTKGSYLDALPLAHLIPLYTHYHFHHPISTLHRDTCKNTSNARLSHNWASECDI